MTLAVARTRDEARLYLDLHPCESCGVVATSWQHGLADAGGELSASWATTCPGCGAERTVLFGLPERQTAATVFPAFGGPEPSQLLDPGEWLQVSDLTAAAVPDGDPAEAGRVLAIAAAAVEEVVKFVPPGADAVPAEAFWTEQGRRLRDADPGRFRLDRLLVVRDAYRDLAFESQLDETLGTEVR